MAKAFLIGLMVGNMKVIIIMIENMAMANSLGPMEGFMMVHGIMENSMVRELLCILETINFMKELEYGKMEKE